jgi:hypothetical protein
MSSIKVPDGYCATCHKKTLDRIDLSTDAEQTLKSLKKKMMVAFMIGDRDGALAEISYQLGITPGELSVAGPWEAPAMDRDMARAIADEIFHKFPDVLEDLRMRLTGTNAPDKDLWAAALRDLLNKLGTRDA